MTEAADPQKLLAAEASRNLQHAKTLLSAASSSFELPGKVTVAIPAGKFGVNTYTLLGTEFALFQTMTTSQFFNGEAFAALSWIAEGVILDERLHERIEALDNPIADSQRQYTKSINGNKTIQVFVPNLDTSDSQNTEA